MAKNPSTIVDMTDVLQEDYEQVEGGAELTMDQ